MQRGRGEHDQTTFLNLRGQRYEAVDEALQRAEMDDIDGALHLVIELD